VPAVALPGSASPGPAAFDGAIADCCGGSRLLDIDSAFEAIMALAGAVVTPEDVLLG
jgi:hypothetical protein